MGKKDGICGELRSHRAAFVGVKGVIWGDGGGNIRVARRWGAIRFLQLVFIELFFGLSRIWNGNGPFKSKKGIGFAKRIFLKQKWHEIFNFSKNLSNLRILSNT